MRRVVGLALTLAVGALATWTASSPLAAATWAVTTVGTTFSPSSVTIVVGDTVAWTGVAGHTVTSDTGAWPLATVNMSVTFPQAGTYSYRCDIHAGMTGQILVQNAPPSTPTRTPTPAPTSTRTPTATPAPPTVTPIPLSTVVGRARLPLIARDP